MLDIASFAAYCSFVGQKMLQAFFYTLNLSLWFPCSGQYWFSMMRYENKILKHGN